MTHATCNGGRWLAAVVAVAALLVGGCRSRESASRPTTASAGKAAPGLVVHVGGTMQPAVAEIAAKFTKKTGIPVELNGGESALLVLHIEAHKKGDLYVCHDPFLDRLMNAGLGADGWHVAALTPVIVVRKGNPLGIRTIDDVLKPNVRAVLTDLEVSTLGHLLPTMFAKARGLDGSDPKVIDDMKAMILKREKEGLKMTRQSAAAATDINLGARDAGIVWNAVARARANGLDILPIDEKVLPTPGVDAVTSATKKVYKLTPVYVSAATLKCSADPDRARAFAEFAAGPDGAEVFSRLGFTPATAEKVYADGRKIAK